MTGWSLLIIINRQHQHLIFQPSSDDIFSYFYKDKNSGTGVFIPGKDYEETVLIVFYSFNL